MKNKGERAITLIALVITIIILLILAGITINLLLGENGILNRAKEGKIGTEVAREKEILQMSLAGIQADNEGNLIFDENTLLKELKNYTNDVEVTKSGNKMYLVKYTDSNREYEVYSNGEIDKAAEKVIDKNPGEFEGEGTETNPYLIQSIEDLVALSNKVNAGESYEGKYFNIENNLNFASRNSYVNPDRTDYGDINGDGTTDALITEVTTEKGFTCIGEKETPFAGNLDGKNHSVKSLWIRKEDYSEGVGAFIGKATSNSIKNIMLEDVDIVCNDYTAGIIAVYEGYDLNIDNCKVSGNIISANREVGAVLGYFRKKNNDNKMTDITITNCENNATIVGKGYCTGGIIGECDSGNTVTIENCANNEIITSTGRIGGIIGQANYINKLIVKNSTNNANLNATGNNGNAAGIIAVGGNNGIEITIENCNNYGNVIGKASYTAGIITELYGVSSAEIKKCNNYGEINSTSGYIGGITGRSEDNCNIYECTNTGNVTGTFYIGGIVGGKEGSNSKPAIITKCYNTGKIEAKIEAKIGGYENGGYRVAGIIGSAGNTEINKCYNKGTILSEAKDYSYVGGISGNEGNVFYSYNAGEIHGASYIGGIVGYTSKEVNNVYNIGDIIQKGDNKSYIGGIAGYLSSKGTENAYNTGKISTGNNASNVGGILGLGYENITNTYNLGKIEAEGQYIGSIVGAEYGENSDNYYLKETFDKGIGKVSDTKTDNSNIKDTEQEIKTIMNSNLATLEGWKEVNNGYPILSWQ